MLYIFGTCTLDTRRRELLTTEGAIPLRPKVFGVLAYLIGHRDRVVSKRELFDQLWPDVNVGDATLNTCIKAARQAVGDSGHSQAIIRTWHGHGYRFIAPVEERQDEPDARKAVQRSATEAAPVDRPTLVGYLGRENGDDENAHSAEGGRMSGLERPAVSDDDTKAVDAPALGEPDGELRQVAVLFANLSEFTKLSAELEPEVVHGFLSRYFDQVDGVVERYGGKIDKHIGDTVMAVFGAPISRGNDLERAVRAASEIHNAVRDMEEGGEWPLRVHIGIACGQALASGVGSSQYRENTITGECANVAAHLVDMAGPSETFISNALYRAVGRIVNCEPVDEVAPNGCLVKPASWRVLGPRREAQQQSHPLVGRHSELRQFGSIIDACRETDRGQVIYVRGEAGIGKSRLVAEFRTIAKRRGFACHTGLVFDFGVGRGEDAIETLTRSLLNVSSHGTANDRRAAIDQALADRVIERDHRLFLNEILDVPQPPDLRAIYEAMDHTKRGMGKQAALAALIRGVAGHQPILLTIEDLHWATTSTLAHLAAFGATVAKCPTLLVLTSRTEGDQLNQLWRGALRDSPFVTIDLPPLQTEEAEQFAGSFESPNSSVVRSCIERAGGNPLFLEHLLLDMQEHIDEVPVTIQSLFQARMDRLSHEDRRALQAASVIGQRFGGEVLAYLIQDPDYDCGGLVEHGLVRVEGTDFLFAHALIQESVYASLLKKRRKAFHRKVAEWFCDHDAVLYAEHLDRAGDDAAPRAYLEAARQQATRYELDQAGRLVQRGLELVGDPETEWDLAWLKGEILREVGALDESLDAYRRALGVANDALRECQARIGLAHNMRLLERYEEALELLDEAEASAGSRIVAVERSQICYHRASVHFRLVNPQECFEQGELALERALQCRSSEHMARALSVLGDACYMRGHMITAHNHFRRCVELAQKHEFRKIEAANLHMLGLTRYFQNEVRTALEDAMAGVEGALEIGQYRSEMLARGIMGGILLDMGDMEASEQQFDQALVLARTYGARSYEPFSLVGLAKILAARGDQPGAIDLVEEAISISREVGMRTSGPRALGALGLITDNSETRKRALLEGEEILREGSISHHYLSFYRDAMESSLNIGDWAGVERYGLALKEYTRSEPLPLSNFFIHRGFTLAKIHQGQTDAVTIEYLRHLYEEAERVGLKCALPAMQASLL